MSSPRPPEGEQASPESDAPASLAPAAFSGLRWGAGARAAATLGTLASAVVLTRLIPPAGFGQFAVILLLFGVASAIGDGMGAALVQRPQLRRAHLQSAMFLMLAGGAAASALVAVLAPLAAPLFGAQVAELAQLATPYFVIAAAGTVPNALLQRELRFRRLGASETAGALTTVGATVALAIAGLDAEALVLGTIAGLVLGTGLNLAAAWPPTPRPRRREVCELLRFAVPSMASSATATASSRIDYAVLGTQVSAATVGYYWRGFQLGVDAQTRLTDVIRRMALPLYARTRDKGHMRALRSRIVRLQTMIVAPLLAGLVLLAGDVVPLLFGELWEPAVLPTQILALAGLATAVAAGTAPLVVAVGRPGAMLVWNLLTVMALVAVVLAAAPFGLAALCAAVVGLRVAYVVGAHWFLLRRFVGVPMRHLWADPAPAVIAAAVMVAVLAALRALVLGPALPALAEALVIAALAPAAYLLALRVAFPAALAELLWALRRLVARRHRAVAAPAQTPEHEGGPAR